MYPWTGASISLTRDLTRLPTIVLRIPHSLHDSINDGTLIVDYGESLGRFEFPTAQGRALAQLGPQAAIPAALRSDWRSELRALPGLDQAVRELYFRNWLEPVRNEQAPHPVPGQRLTVRLLTRAEKVVIDQAIVIGQESLQGIMLTPKD